MKKAILFGASGFIGSYLLDELLKNADYAQVTIVVRKNLNIYHPKLKVLIGDYHTLAGLEEYLVGDEIFIALGTTKKNTPDLAKYYHIDHDYPVLAATIAKDNGAKSVFLVTAIGADPNSNIFYIRTKGKTEEDIIALNFQHTHIFQPSMLMGNRKENRPLEKFFIKIFTVVNALLVGKKLRKYKGISGNDVAKAMINAAKNQTVKIKTYQWQEMHDLL